jgi:hypothetical protein
MFEKTLRRRIVKVFAMVQIVVYLLLGKVLRTTLMMNGDVGKTAQIVVQGTGSLAVDGKTLFQCKCQFFEFGYLSRGRLKDRPRFFLNTYPMVFMNPLRYRIFTSG